MDPTTRHPREHGGTARGKQLSARRVRDLLSAAIREGIIGADELLAEDELVALFDSSRGSVRAALNELRDSGFIERTPRVGTRVNRLGMTVPIAEIPPLVEDLNIAVTEDRIVPNVRLLKERLGVDVDEVRMVENTFSFEGEIVGVRAAYFASPLDTDPRDLAGPMDMKQTIEAFFQVQPGEAFVSISSARADAHTARLLKVSEGWPLIVREMIYYSVDGAPIQVVFDHFRGDRVRLEATVAEI